MTNQVVIDRFLCEQDGKGSNLYCKNRILYSYGLMLALYDFDNSVIVNTDLNKRPYHYGLLIKTIMKTPTLYTELTKWDSNQMAFEVTNFNFNQDQAIGDVNKREFKVFYYPKIFNQ